MARDKGNRFNFDREGVVITLPEEARNLRARSLPIDIPEFAQAVTDIHIIRVLINVVIFDKDNPDLFLSEFESPFELRVRYTADDLEQAQNRDGQLTLAVYIHDQWMRLTPEKHQFSLQADPDPAAGGVGTALIRSWGDPPVAWVV